MSTKKIRANSDYLKKLLEAPSPSGIETAALDVFKNEMKDFRTFYYDKMGNTAYAYGDGDTYILLSGHIDEVSCRVSYIADNGIISMLPVGGPDGKVFISSHINILTDDGTLIDGIVEKKAIHCEEADDRKKVDEIHKMKINVGAESKAEVESMGIHIGSPIIYSRNTNMNFGKNQICSQGLDDKIGVFIASEIMKRLKDDYDYAYRGHFPSWGDKYTVICLAAVQEETGLRGANVAAAAINADVSIDFDVTFANDGDVKLDKGKYGDLKLGNGGVIQYGPDKSDRLNRILVGTGIEKDIKFQMNATRAGGTNTNAIQLRSKDCETTLMSIPNRSMHTSVEVVDWRDVQSIVDIVSSAIINCKI